MFRAPAAVTEQEARMSEELKALQGQAQEALRSDTVPDEAEAEATIARFNTACIAAGLPAITMITRARYQQCYGYRRKI